VKKQSLYQFRKRRRRPEPTPSSLCPPYNILIKDSNGSMQVSAYVSAVYAV